jgi:cellulose synthase/poly-beta-1,6-N-acetylglucosamine synthase-like glycosyltransferase
MPSWREIDMLRSVFWFSAFLIVYHHALYPLILRLLAGRPEPKPQFAPPAQESLPSITVIVPCHNEAAVIERKIENLEALDYPREKLLIVLALDGCTDSTAELARSELSTSTLNHRIVEYAVNIGKVAVLNEHIRSCTTDIVALSDASSLVNPDALMIAASRFAEPSVGVVSSSYCVTDPDNPGEQAYWQYQIAVKKGEARLGAPLGAHGAFYLFRRNLWTELPADTINDDFVLPMRIVLRGYRAVYEDRIACRELERARSPQEFRRRMRIGAGNLQQIIRLWRLASPRLGGISFAFVSGKGLRALMPFVLLVCFAASIHLGVYQGGVYGFILMCELLVIAVAAIAAGAPHSIKLPAKIRALEYLFIGYIATGLGALMLLTGYSSRVWEYSRRAKATAVLTQKANAGTLDAAG